VECRQLVGCGKKSRCRLSREETQSNNERPTGNGRAFDFENDPMPELNDTAASRLCAACGMCCNGVLFHGMQVQPHDSLRSLASKGLKPKRRDGDLFFPQPCPAHQDSCCKIYNDRPQRCRAFVCKQLAAVLDGKKTEDAALEKIREARVLTAEIFDLLVALGDSRDHRALAVRCAGIFTPPLDSSPEATSLREVLQVAMEKLDRLLSMDFRTP
jgi:hypothetical protein